MEDNGVKNNKGDGPESAGTTDPSVLWNRLQESQQQKMKMLEEETQKLTQESEALQKMKDEMGSIVAKNIRDDDIIEINAGGRFFLEAHRSTLCLAEGTVFSNMFSGRWEDSLARDKHGRVFLDHDPELVEHVINFLRLKKIADPSKPVPCPKIPDEKKEAFRLLLHYFGLTEFFSPQHHGQSLDLASIEVVQLNDGSLVDVTRNESNVRFLYNGSGDYFVGCTPSLIDSCGLGGGSAWKITIDALGWIFLGIIGNLQPSSNYSYQDSTCYGWTGGAEVYHQGVCRYEESGWTSFVEGECLYFHFQSNKLVMFSVRKNQKFVIDDVISTDDTRYYIHFNFCTRGTTATLEPLSREELDRMHA